jgi:hypothetical protein
MERVKVAAHFAAFVWFLNRDNVKEVAPDEAGRLARRHWQDFLPCADERLSALVADSTPRRSDRPRRQPRRRLAGAPG